MVLGEVGLYAGAVCMDSSENHRHPTTWSWKTIWLLFDLVKVLQLDTIIDVKLKSKMDSWKISPKTFSSYSLCMTRKWIMISTRTWVTFFSNWHNSGTVWLWTNVLLVKFKKKPQGCVVLQSFGGRNSYLIAITEKVLKETCPSLPLLIFNSTDFKSAECWEESVAEGW